MTEKKTPRRRARYCQLPSPGNIAGRSSSITNAFFNAIIPIHPPSLEDELEALQILGMNPEDIRCAYCGDISTEWDHLRPIITNQMPTGYITEIANLVPACGKCNQSKGKSDWKKWIVGPARLSPTTKGKPGLEQRIARLTAYENWRKPVKIDFDAVVDPEVWARHRTNWRAVLDLLVESQKLAKDIRETIDKSAR